MQAQTNVNKTLKLTVALERVYAVVGNILRTFDLDNQQLNQHDPFDDSLWAFLGPSAAHTMWY